MAVTLLLASLASPAASFAQVQPDIADQAQIQADQVRVSSKDRDILQQVIQLLRSQDLPVALQFVNFRE